MEPSKLGGYDSPTSFIVVLFVRVGAGVVQLWWEHCCHIEHVTFVWIFTLREKFVLM
jgi:hypothetical protein